MCNSFPQPSHHIARRRHWRRRSCSLASVPSLGGGGVPPQDCFYGLFCCSVIAAKPGCIQRLAQEQGEGVSGERVLYLFNQLFNCAFLHLPVCIYRKRNKARRANYKKRSPKPSSRRRNHRNIYPVWKFRKERKGPGTKPFSEARGMKTSSVKGPISLRTWALAW